MAYKFIDYEIMCLKSHFATLKDKREITNCDFKEWIYGKMLTYLADNDILYAKTRKQKIKHVNTNIK